MSYKPLSGYRKLVAASAIGLCLGGAFGPPRSLADELVENNILTSKFGKVCSLLVKAKGSSFDYDLTDLDVNGDNKPDKIKLILKQGDFVTKQDYSGTVDGPRLDIQFDIGDSFGSERKIYGIVDRDGKVSICKSRNLGTGGSDVEPYLDALIRRLEK